MANLYRNSNDKWRAYGYQKAIGTLKKCHRPVTTYEVDVSSRTAISSARLLGNSNVAWHWFSVSGENRGNHGDREHDETRRVSDRR